MANQTEGKKVSDVVKYEAPDRYSRKNLILATGFTSAIGDVLGIKATDKYDVLKADETAPVDTDAEAIALEVVVGNDTLTCLCAVRHCIVDKAQLNYGAATDSDLADDALEVLGIVPRKEAPNAAQV